MWILWRHRMAQTGVRGCGFGDVAHALLISTIIDVFLISFVALERRCHAIFSAWIYWSCIFNIHVLWCTMYSRVFLGIWWFWSKSVVSGRRLASGRRPPVELGHVREARERYEGGGFWCQGWKHLEASGSIWKWTAEKRRGSSSDSFTIGDYVMLWSCHI